MSPNPQVNTVEIRNHANLVWSIAELLRGDYKRSEYGRVILPLVVMRRLDQLLLPTKAAVLARAAALGAAGYETQEPLLLREAKRPFYNRSSLVFSARDEGIPGVKAITADTGNVAVFLRSYLDGYSSLAREVFENFDFERQIERLDKAGVLYKVISKICEVDLHPDSVSNLEMGYMFEELIRRFAEQSNETAGEHFTPREVVRLMVNLLLDGDDDVLRDPGVIRTVFDCACGTGGMLSEAEQHIHALNEQAVVHVHGQELNAESYAICLADMLVKGQDASHIVRGNSLSDDGHRGERFHYGIANPPFGVDWSKVEDEVREEHKSLGQAGRFGPGLPRKSDGQLLFLLHLMSKMREPGEGGGGRVAIVLNGAPLSTGGPGSGESEIRRYIIENDMLEAIVGLPEQLFYNTGIATYVWLVTNRKSPDRQGKVQLIDARDLWVKMRKSLGEKRREISAEQIAEITRLHGAFEEGEHVKILENERLGYRSVVVEQPLRARWEIGPETWTGVEEEKVLTRLDSESDLPAVCAVLARLPHAQYNSEEEVAGTIKAGLLETLPKVTPAMLKTCVARALVRDPAAPPLTDKKGQVLPDRELRDAENVPLPDNVDEYLEHEVRPHVEGAWCSDPEGRVGYEIPFTRLFYKRSPPRSREAIKGELRDLEGQVRQLLEEVLV